MQMNSINIAEMFELVHENWNVTIEMKVVEQWFEQRSQLVLLSFFHKRSAFVSFEDVRHFYFCFTSIWCILDDKAAFKFLGLVVLCLFSKWSYLTLMVHWLTLLKKVQ